MDGDEHDLYATASTSTAAIDVDDALVARSARSFTLVLLAEMLDTWRSSADTTAR
jgi:hypothetical protein